MNNIRKRADQLVERLEQVWDRFKNLKVQDLEGDEILYREMRDRFGLYFEGGMGAAAIQKRLESFDLDAEADLLQEIIATGKGQKKTRAIKRLKVVNAFQMTTNHPSGMVLDAIPVIPPDLRPMVQLDGGRFATSDLNDLYRRVINRNNRLKRLLDLGAPEIIVNNEKRMLQEAVDSLFDNGRRGRPVTGPGNRPLKSLSDMLKGKQGRFRQNLLGKRVDYSGRSVIVVGPQLKLHQCGLPKQMALELFKPFVMKRLVDLDHAQNIKSAKRMVERARPVVWDVLEEVITEHPVLLNRAPTLHRLGIQAFEPQLVEGKAIQIHPLVCSAFNADFDGDQMAVHVPLSAEAQAEARILMLSSNNILKPADGRPVTMPTQDMITGIYHLTDAVDGGGPGAGRAFSSPSEARMAFDRGEILLGSAIKLRLTDAVPPAGLELPEGVEAGEDGIVKSLTLETTLGRAIFNDTLPLDYPFENRPVDRKRLSAIVNDLAERYSKVQVAASLDALKEAGFHWSTRSGCTVAISDVTTPDNKTAILEGYETKAAKVQTQYERGLITDDERRQELVEIWTQASNQVAKEMETNFPRTNPIYRMVSSGAGGNWFQIRQIAGMRGLMANPKGEIIPRPIKANFREGLTVLEFFISTHGARKGLADTALRTADSGYLTRRLVDVSQDVIIREDDCGTERGLKLPIAQVNETTGTRAPSEVVEASVYARTLAEDVVVDGETLAVAGIDLGDVVIDALYAAGVDEVRIRSVLTCDSKVGTCAACYGRSLATGKLVDIGEAVGIIAAQSIGEPGTQLTMRTFHTGGAAAADDITQGLPRVVELFEARTPKGVAPIAEATGRIEIEDTDKARRDPAHAGRRLRAARLPGEQALAPRRRRRRPRRGRHQAGPGRDRPQAGPSHPRPARGPEAPRRRGAAGLPPAGCVDPRQAHRGHRAPDAAARDDHRGRRRRPAARRARRAWSLRGREPSRHGRGWPSGRRSSRAHGHHQGLARDRVVAVGRVLPGDDPRAHAGRHGGQVRPAARPQGERHPRKAHPCRHGPAPLPERQGRAHRGGQGRDVLAAELRRLRLRRLRFGHGRGHPSGRRGPRSRPVLTGSPAAVRAAAGDHQRVPLGRLPLGEAGPRRRQRERVADAVDRVGERSTDADRPRPARPC